MADGIPIIRTHHPAYPYISYWKYHDAIRKTARIEIQVPAAESLSVTEDTLAVDLSDGRTISVPLAWYPRLNHASPSELNNWRLIGKGHGIHWEDLDEDISVEGLLAGKPSGESHTSFRNWLANQTNQPAQAD